MYQYTRVAIAGAFWGAVMAQNSTVSLALLNVDQQPLLASIAGSNADATTYIVACPSGTSPDDCGLIGDLTVTQGPSTLHFTSSYSSDYPSDAFTDPGSLSETRYTNSFNYDCKITSSRSGFCSLTASQSFNGSTTTTVDSTSVTRASDLGYVIVTVTATGSGGASATTTSSHSASSSNSSKSASSSSSSGSKGAAGASTSNPAMPAVTAKAQWAVGGAAAAAALAFAAM